jgi:hypothetical protein
VATNQLPRKSPRSLSDLREYCAVLYAISKFRARILPPMCSLWVVCVFCNFMSTCMIKQIVNYVILENVL